MNPERYQLGDLVQARAVAVVGASQDPTRIGGRPIAFLKDAGFAGAIYPVNAKYPEVQGLRAYADLDGVPGPVDVAIISVPARDVIAAVAACGRKGVKGAIVFSSGFAEVGAAGRAQQGDLVRAAGQAGVRIIGPNCQGLVALHRRASRRGRGHGRARRREDRQHEGPPAAGGGRPVLGLRQPDIWCRTRTPATPGAEAQDARSTDAGHLRSRQGRTGGR